MPREAANVGALDAVAPLAQIPRELLARLKQLDSY
jgi:chemotaxis response regulator CheB